MTYKQFETYSKLLTKKLFWYKNIKEIYCPYLKTNIIFNSQGIHHLKYNGRGKLRSLNDRIRRLHLINYSLNIIKNAKSVFEYRNINNIQYWSFREFKNNKTITILIRKVGNGKHIFYSVM